MIFDHTIRKAKWGQDSKVDGLGPAMRVHVDQTTEASIQRVKDNMGDDAERLLKGRFQVRLRIADISGLKLIEHLRRLSICGALSAAQSSLRP